VKWDEQADRLLRKGAMDEKSMIALIAAAGIAPEIIGFHAQQAAEKYLKALLSHLHVAFGRTHDLRTLLDLLEIAGYVPPAEVQEICQLMPYAVEFRYQDIPDAPFSHPTHDLIISRVKSVRLWVEGIIHPPKK
jgi:HEPN domain-containing protein